MSQADFFGPSLVLTLALLLLLGVLGQRLVGEVAAVDLVAGVTIGTIAGSTSISDRILL